MQQAAYKKILDVDLQSETSNSEIQQLTNQSSTSSNGTSNNNKTDEQKKAEYEKSLENDNKEYKTSRYIVKYSDTQSMPEFSDGGKKNNGSTNIDPNKISSAGIKSSNSIKGDKKKEYTVFSLESEMNSDDFLKALKSSGLDKDVEFIQPDYTMSTSSDPLLAQQWGFNGTQINPVSVGCDVLTAWIIVLVMA
jgi:hypothetical protein